MRLRTFAMIAALIVLVFGGIAVVKAVDSDDDLVPVSYGPTNVDGHCYAGYFYDKDAEPAQFGDFGRNCTPYQYPPARPVETMADFYIQMKMWEYLTGNDGWLRGPTYYDRVLLPASRHSTVIVVNRDTWNKDGSRFRSTYRSDHTQNVKKYPPTFKKANDKAASPKLFKGDDFASKANKRSDNTVEQTRKKFGGLNAGPVADQAKAKDKTGNKRRVQTQVGGDAARDPARATPAGGATQKPNRTSGGSNTGKTTTRTTTRSRR